jgi:hypothetical protein
VANELSDREKAAIVGGVVGGVAVLGGLFYLLYLFRDKDIRIKVRLLYEDVETGGVRPVPGGAAVRVLDHDGASTPFEMGNALVLADGVIDKTVSDDGTREINPDIMFEVTVPAAPAALPLINWPAPGIASRRNRRDPMVGGISIIGVNSPFGMGTIGGLISTRNNDAPRILSNWHILSGQAPAPPHPANPPPIPPPVPAGLNVIQPGTGEAVPGTAANDLVGVLADHRLGAFGGHDMDAAIARLNPSRPGAGGGNDIVVLPRKLVDDEPAPGQPNGPPAGVQGWEMIDDDLVRGIVPDAEIGPNLLGLEVWQSGRTSGVKRAQITGMAAISRVTHGAVFPPPGFNHNAGDLLTALARPDSPAPYVVGAGGDSGAYVMEVGTNRVLGLHFTGTVPQDMTFCRIEPILNQFAVDLRVHRVHEDYQFRRLYQASFFGIRQAWTSRDDVPEPQRTETFFPSYGETTLERTITIPLTELQIHARFIYFDATLGRFMPVPEGIVVEVLDRAAGAARPVLGTRTTNANGEIHAVFAKPVAEPQIAFRITRDTVNRFPDDPSLRKLDRLGFFPGGAAAASRYESQNGGFLRFDIQGAIALETNVPVADNILRNRSEVGTVDTPLVFPVAHIIGPPTARKDRDTAYRAYNGGAATTWQVRNETKAVVRAAPPNGPTLTYRPDAADDVGDTIRISSPAGGNSILITVTAAQDARIVTDAQARSFHPGRASETGRAQIFVDSPTPGRRVTWEQSQLDATQQGQVVFQPSPSEGGITTMKAGFPGRTRVRALVGDPAGDFTTTDYVNVSVPQFVRVVFRPEFDQDLVAFGLRRVAPQGGALNEDQNRANERVKQAVMDQALNVACWHYDNAKANVRFTTNVLSDLAPMPLVLVEVGGDRPAAGHPDQPADRNAGARMELTRAANTGVFPGEFLNFSVRPDRAIGVAPAFPDPQFDQIYDPIRPGALGTPVGRLDPVTNEVDYPVVPPAVGAVARTRYDQIVRAIRVLGNLIGESIAHNVGHTLGLTHSAASAPRQLMDPEADRTFVERALSGSGLGAEFTPAEANQLHQAVGQVGPFIASVTPNSGPVAGGIGITIDGRGFTTVADTRLTIMGIPVTPPVVVNEGQITCTTPGRVAGWAGSTRVFIANGDGTFLLPRGFQYT